MRGYSSVVEHSTADREVPGSNPGCPLLCFIEAKRCLNFIWLQYIVGTVLLHCCDGRVVKAFRLEI